MYLGEIRDSYPNGLGMLVDSDGKEIHNGVWLHGVFKDKPSAAEDQKIKKLVVALNECGAKHFEYDSPSHKDRVKQRQNVKEASKVRNALFSVEKVDKKEKHHIQVGSYCEIDFPHVGMKL